LPLLPAVLTLPRSGCPTYLPARAAHTLHTLARLRLVGLYTAFCCCFPTTRTAFPPLRCSVTVVLNFVFVVTQLLDKTIPRVVVGLLDGWCGCCGRWFDGNAPHPRTRPTPHAYGHFTPPHPVAHLPHPCPTTCLPAQLLLPTPTTPQPTIPHPVTLLLLGCLHWLLMFAILQLQRLICWLLLHLIAWTPLPHWNLPTPVQHYLVVVVVTLAVVTFPLLSVYIYYITPNPTCRTRCYLLPVPRYWLFCSHCWFELDLVIGCWLGVTVVVGLQLIVVEFKTVEFPGCGERWDSHVYSRTTLLRCPFYGWWIYAPVIPVHAPYPHLVTLTPPLPPSPTHHTRCLHTHTHIYCGYAAHTHTYTITLHYPIYYLTNPYRTYYTITLPRTPLPYPCPHPAPHIYIPPPYSCLSLALRGDCYPLPVGFGLGSTLCPSSSLITLDVWLLFTHSVRSLHPLPWTGHCSSYYIGSLFTDLVVGFHHFPQLVPGSRTGLPSGA